MKTRFATVFAAVAVSSFVCAQDFQDSSFETPVLGYGQWVRDPHGTAWHGVIPWGMANGPSSWGWGAHSGNQYGYVQSNPAEGGAGAMYQTVNGFTVGGQYRVAFWMACRDGAGAYTGNAITVMAGSTVILGPTLPNPDFSWNLYTTNPFTATAFSQTISWIGQTPGTGLHTDTASLFDDVHIQVVPEPAPLLALCGGVLFLWQPRRRRRARTQNLAA